MDSTEGGLKVLLVDDGPENLQVLGQLLRPRGYALTAATNGAQALAYVQQHRPDLVLLDLMMPDIDGLEVCRRMRQLPHMGQVPILFLSARSDQDSINSGLEAGGDDYVTKPFNARELLNRVEKHLERAQAIFDLDLRNHEYRELLHVLSHDLANPLGTIISFTELIGGEPELGPELIEKIARLADNSLELIDLIRRMRFLDEKGIEVGPVNLREVILEALDISRTRLVAKELTVELEGGSEDFWVLAEHSSLIYSVLSNLLTNAIKFSHPGGVIHLSLSSQAEEAVVLLADQGIGMTPNLMSDLFDITKRTSRVGTAGEQGTGFGMPLVKKFMAAYGGKVAVRSKDQPHFPESHGTQVELHFRACNCPQQALG
ncbi:MAG: hybrid sensor histidine kinase/response regulator [bacterium]|nr:hybrid sensor histidine kinase/response regulator [bacterium]